MDKSEGYARFIACPDAFLTNENLFSLFWASPSPPDLYGTWNIAAPPTDSWRHPLVGVHIHNVGCSVLFITCRYLYFLQSQANAIGCCLLQIRGPLRPECASYGMIKGHAQIGASPSRIHRKLTGGTCSTSRPNSRVIRNSTRRENHRNTPVGASSFHVFHVA